VSVILQLDTRLDCSENSIVQKIPLPRVLLHEHNDSSEEAEAKAAAQLVHKIVHEAFTNHNQMLVNSIGNVMKEVFYGAPIDQVGPAYFNAYNPSAMGSNVPSSSQQPKGG
jgi:hypothetical protein